MKDLILAEAKRLHNMGFAIHWLHPKSKRPIESGWTTGPRAEWEYLKETYIKGLNVGVRLGTPSKIKNGFLAIFDVDIKSKDPKHLSEAALALRDLTGTITLPEVSSGRGNGSRHYYIVTPEALKPFLAKRSTETVKVSMPSAGKPSKRELERLTPQEIANGIRLRPAWEIGVMGDGQQVVLPPSIHPDTGKNYSWVKNFEGGLTPLDLSKLTKPEDDAPKESTTTSEPAPLDDVKEKFVVSPVELSWLPTSDKIKGMIISGEGVTDRSAMLLPVSHALVQAGLTRNEVLTVLTDTNNYMGACAFEHAKTKDRTRAARWLYKYTVKKVIHEQSAEFMFREPITEPVPLTEDEYKKEQDENEKLRHWTDDLELTKDDKYRTTLKNTVTILQHVAGGLAIVKRDLFAYRDFYSVDTPWGGVKDKAITDDDVSKIKLWLGKYYGMEPSSNTIGEALTILATDNAFDPAVDWLGALPAWDETPRLDGWLKEHFGAKGQDDYLAQVFRKWMVAMVMRILKPGAKFDWMPIFEGAQGVGKSSFGRILIGDKLFLDWLPDLANKDSALALQGVGLVEMGELASFRKNEIETVKAFITRTVDKVRPPYGERWIESPRRCVFFGTTNYETYLRDDSGNRRFKPCKVGRLNFDQLEIDRDQLFAEALWLYRTGFENERTLEIDGEAKIYERQIQADKMVSDESVLMQESLQHFIEGELKKEEDERFIFTKFRLQELFEKQGNSFQGIGPLAHWKYDSRNAQYGAKALKNLNGEKFKSNGGVFWKLSL